METDIKSCIALICAVRINKKKYSGMFDVSLNKINLYSITSASDDNIDLYDFERNSYISGNYRNLFDSYTSSFITLEFNDNQFNGYDFESKTFFSGSVTSTSVSFYDYSKGEYNFYLPS